MAKKTKITEPTQAEQNVGEILSKTDQFIEKHLKAIIVAIVAIIVVVVAFIGIRHAYILPKEKEAEAAIFPGERYLSEQNYEVALNGDSIGYVGFLSVVDEYGCTPSGNLAKAYSGICYYHLGDYKNALDQLKAYKGKDQLVAATVSGLIGDCYVDSGDTKKAIDYFEKAVKKADSSTIGSIYLKKAGLANESLGNYKAALEKYNTIKNKYPESQEAAGIEKYIERAQKLSK